MLAEAAAATAGLDADQLDAGVGDEGIKHAGRVAAAAHAGQDHVGQPAQLLQALLPGFRADDRLEIAHDHRERMRADHAADDVMRRFDGRHPVAHGLVDGVAQRFAAGLDAV